MSNRLKQIIFLVVILIAVISLQVFNRKIYPQKGIKYVPIGDSYTIGLGVKEGERWPNILVDHLKKRGIDIYLASNPAVSGYTVRDAIEIEFPIVSKIKPDLVTVLVGANDNFSQRGIENYRNDLKELLNKLESLLEKPRNIVLITIPDHTKSPSFREYPKEEALKLIEEYNQIIKEEGKKRGLKVADIFPISQKLIDENDFVFDGLHPSVKSYQEWEKAIFPIVLEILRVN
ncbi:MAG: Lipolytic protein G-D-S-L family [Candidatus Roizmanbacteria bacterium GW2011_GWA2_35_19]|uniref:Lipolytic protein G-D-S-L family n=2 Tax=Candidatus Roizmaniibacteriota TaxID=1752723 RepID=A0A0G0BQQ4_9BACT|nr:MAG: Lipolytic protein G-D-S-L family [Candidatus Roizmanbacteria bacterium GW2011_GWC2_35_12]KKP71723.1 MAG: Lipolytic protein G-D-S-L family [Candidatus Roizmanbacteria bacterium GW2011_GWA2_35_19]